MARLPFIDWVRGFAVLAMVLWHTADGWLSPGLRDGLGWTFLRFVGGLAAPSFLFLAGTAAALGARNDPDPVRRARALRGALGRGLEVLLIGYLIRFQTWMIDAAAIRQLGSARAFLPLGAGYAVLVWSVNQLEHKPRRAVWSCVVGLGLCVLGASQVESVAPGRLGRLLQVDVLQAIGMSLVLLALLERGFGLLQRPALAGLLGVLVMCATEPVGRALPGVLPDAIAAYLGKWPAPTGRPPAALFPLLPWFAYACLGASVGALLRARREQPERMIVALSLLGALLALLSSEAMPYVQTAFASQPWLVHPGRVIFRVGIVLTLFLVGYVWTAPQRGRVLLDYGKASLRVYWCHMLFAYGVLGRPLQKSTSYGRWILWACVLLLAMWGLARLRRRAPSPAKAALGLPTR